MTFVFFSMTVLSSRRQILSGCLSGICTGRDGVARKCVCGFRVRQGRGSNVSHSVHAGLLIMTTIQVLYSRPKVSYCTAKGP